MSYERLGNYQQAIAELEELTGFAPELVDPFFSGLWV